MSFFRRTLTGTNYCGPGGSGPVLNAVDAACAAHDKAYTAPYLYDYYKSEKADRALVSSLYSARPVGWRDAFTKQVAVRYFTTKLKYHEMQGKITDPSFGFVVKKERNFPAPVPKRARLAIAAAPVKWVRRAAAPLPFYRSRAFYGKPPRQSFIKSAARRSRFRYLGKNKKLRYRRYRK